MKIKEKFLLVLSIIIMFFTAVFWIIKGVIFAKNINSNDGNNPADNSDSARNGDIERINTDLDGFERWNRDNIEQLRQDRDELERQRESLEEARGGIEKLKSARNRLEEVINRLKNKY